MFIVFPVYASSLVISKSTHQALLGPGPTYKPYGNHESREIHRVSWIPGPWVSKTESVLSDGQVFILDGHDTGMLIPHLSRIMDNLLLPVTLLTSSCTWPFVTAARSVGGKCVVGFFPKIAPFIFCDAPDAGGSSSKAEVEELGKQGKVRVLGLRDAPVKASNASKESLALLRRKERNRSRALALGRAGGKHAIRATRSAQKLAKALEPITKVDGKGLIYIPFSKTVLMQMSLSDLLKGWARLFVGNAIGALTAPLFTPIKLGSPMVVRQNSKANPAMSLFSASATQRVTRRQIGSYLGTTLVNKAAVDGALKPMVLDMKINAPYGIFKYDINKGKGSYLYWGTFDGVRPPEEFPIKGLQTRFNEWAGKGLDTKPIDVLTQTPNVAGG